MRSGEWLPVSGILGLVLLLGLGPVLFPAGTGLLLVRLPNGSDLAALEAVAAVPAALVALPRPGFAVLHGDAAAVRARFGWVFGWQGGAPCG